MCLGVRLELAASVERSASTRPLSDRAEFTMVLLRGSAPEAPHSIASGPEMLSKHRPLPSLAHENCQPSEFV